MRGHWRRHPFADPFAAVGRGPFLAVEQALRSVDHGLRGVGLGMRGLRHARAVRQRRRYSIVRLLLAGLAVLAIVKIVSELQASGRSRGEKVVLIAALLAAAGFAYSLRGRRPRW